MCLIFILLLNILRNKLDTYNLHKYRDTCIMILVSLHTKSSSMFHAEFVYKLLPPKWRILTMKTLSYKFWTTDAVKRIGRRRPSDPPMPPLHHLYSHTPSLSRIRALFVTPKFCQFSRFNRLVLKMYVFSNIFYVCIMNFMKRTFVSCKCPIYFLRYLAIK
jgi:hypothetical protein